MNPEYVSAEDRRVQTRLLGIPSTQHPLVCPPGTSSPTVLEDSHELRRKQKIIGRTLEKITERGLCGFEPLKGYLSELYRCNCRPNTLRTHAATILSFLLYLKQCGQARLEGIGRGDIGGFVEHEQDRGLTACTIATRLRGLYSFLRFMVQRGELSSAVLTGKLRIKLPESLPRAIDPQSVRQLLAVIDHVRDRAIVLVLLRTGMRIGELLDTRLADMDLNEQKIEILEAQKTRVGRVVYLSEDACAVLRKWLCIDPRKAITSSTVWAGRGLATKPSAAGLIGTWPRRAFPRPATACTACGIPMPVNCSTPGCAWSACSSFWGTVVSR